MILFSDFPKADKCLSFQMRLQYEKQGVYDCTCKLLKKLYSTQELEGNI